MSRILVTGSYVNKGEYRLTKEDGTIFLVIKEGEPFKIANQMRKFVPQVVPNKNGHGTVMVCRKFDNFGGILEEFYLPNNKPILWATSSGSARKGVAHIYHAPSTPLENALERKEAGKSSIHKVDSIELELTLGGELGHQYIKRWGRLLRSDGEINAGEVDPDYGTYDVKLHGGTFAVVWTVSTTMNGSYTSHVEGVYITPEADERKVIAAIMEV